jgi:hypothetical protein
MISGPGGASSGEVAGSGGRMTRLDTIWTSTVAPSIFVLCFPVAKLGGRLGCMFRQTFTTHL